jgi:glycosyltransferase involved in cell wall biosynthesis
MSVSDKPLLPSDLPPPPDGRTGWPWQGCCRALPPTTGDGKPWPKLIIVTPSFNQGAYLEAAIRSVLLQGYPNLTYVVMDGGSTDESVDILKKYDRWITRWVSEADDGQYDAVAKGFASGGGDVMSWLNSDDMYCPDALRVAGSVFSDLPDVSWLTSGVQVTWDVDGAWVSTGHSAGYTRRGFFAGRNLGLTGRAAALQPVIQQESTFWRHSLWDVAGGDLDATLDLAGDFELWARFWAHAVLATVNVPLGGFRRQPEQKTADPEAYQREARDVLTRHGGRVRGNMSHTLAATFGAWQKSPADLRARVRYDLEKKQWIKVERYVA